MNRFRMLMMGALLFVIAGCGGGGGGSDKLDDTNKQFLNGDYAGALQNYISLIADEGGPAQVGAGWCQIKLKNLTSAATYFSDAAADSLVDGYAGWSFVLWAQNDPQGAIDKAEFVLTKQPAYVFALDPDVTANSLVWIEAASYLQLQNYAECYNKIKILESSYTVNLSDPNIEDLLLAKVTSLGSATPI